MTNFFDKYVGGMTKDKGAQKKTVSELLKMNESDMFMELIRDIATELDVNVLCHKIIVNVGIMTRCERGRFVSDNRIVYRRMQFRKLNPFLDKQRRRSLPEFGV
jgi:hypothetical protein